MPQLLSGSRPDHALVALSRGFRVQRLREYEVNRQAILTKAIVDAATNGYAFDADLPNKTRDRDWQARWRAAHADTPTRVYLVAFLQQWGRR